MGAHILEAIDGRTSGTLLFSFLNIYLCIVCVTVQVRKSEGSLGESILSSYHVVSGPGTSGLRASVFTH